MRKKSKESNLNHFKGHGREGQEREGEITLFFQIVFFAIFGDYVPLCILLPAEEARFHRSKIVAVYVVRYRALGRRRIGSVNR